MNMRALSRKLITSKRNTIDIVTSDPTIIDHWIDPRNYTDVVLDMFNNDRFYDELLGNTDDLIVIDIGANVGLFSLYIQDRAKLVYSLEPTPNHFRILQELTAAYQNINPLNMALHHSDCDIDLFINRENSTMNSTANQYGERVTVKGCTLAGLMDKLGVDGVDFIKCDIEGAEMLALTNETLEPVRDRINAFSLEVHQTDHSVSWAESVERNRDHLVKLFIDHGFKAGKHRHDSVFALRS